MKRGLWGAAVCAAVLGCSEHGAMAGDLSDFFLGKQLTVYVGSSAGGGTDIYGRLVAQFLGGYIPGHPRVSVVNLPGANGLAAANELARTFPRDGTSIATFDRAVGMQAIWGNPAARFRATDLNWIGSVNVDTSTCVTWRGSGIETLDEFLTRPVLVGSSTVYDANLLDSLFGAKLKLVQGYPGGNDVTLALERGEVQGRCNWSWSSIVGTKPDWLRDHKINVLLQFAEQRSPDLPNVPLVTDLAKNQHQRQIIDLLLSTQTMARPFVAPPAVPPDRVAALRSAFMKMTADPRFVEAAQARHLELSPVDGARIQSILSKVAETPKPVIRELRDDVLGAEASAAMGQ